MCLIVFAHQTVPGYPLVLIANRDEFLNRPAAPLGWWEEHPDLLAGKDLSGGGTWLGVNRRGKWAALTNYRDPKLEREGRPTRGTLVLECLLDNLTPFGSSENRSVHMDQYNGFNLLTGNTQELSYLSNQSPASPYTLNPGIYGVSNHLIDTPWPKVSRTKERFRALIADGVGEASTENLAKIMFDRTKAPVEELPDTGIGFELELAISSPFIDLSYYGTRATTVLLIREDGLVKMQEWGRGETSPGPMFEFFATK